MTRVLYIYIYIYLYLYIDERSSKTVENKFSESIDLFFRAKQVFDKTSLQVIYMLYIRSYLNCGVITWGYTNTKKLKKAYYF